MLTFQHPDTIFERDYSTKLVGPPKSIIDDWNYSRNQLAQTMRNLKNCGITNEQIRDFAARTHTKCVKPTKDNLWQYALKMAHIARENRKEFCAGCTQHMPCGTDDAWYENNIDYPRALAIQAYLAIQLV